MKKQLTSALFLTILLTVLNSTAKEPEQRVLDLTVIDVRSAGKIR
ncbi:MAG: hypothetical protein WA738_11970 [Candidatus Angelobacter sp.]